MKYEQFVGFTDFHLQMTPISMGMHMGHIKKLCLLQSADIFVSTEAESESSSHSSHSPNRS